VRNRLNVLSEIPDKWAAFARQSARAHAELKTTLEDGTVAPDANEEYMIYQTILGAWPWMEKDRADFPERIKAYLAKALSEGKVNVSWINPRPEYTEAVQLFVDRLLKPDNRRPVDYKYRAQILESFQEKDQAGNDRPLDAVARDVLSTLDDGRVKLFTMQRVLAVRNAHQALFAAGSYTPLTVSDPDHAFAYMRGDDVLVVIPRFTCGLTGGRAEPALGDAWKGQSVTLPEQAADKWVHAFTGRSLEAGSGSIPLAELFIDFPVALLTRAE
jgi:(1->4)-alpha-D-glucan 1-alpha-D-glucosylmutase